MTPLPLFSSLMLYVIGAFVCAIAILLLILFVATLEKKSERKTILWLTGLVSSVFLLYVAFYASAGLIGSRQVNDAIAQLKRSGAKVTLEEAIPPKIPDNENAALCYKEAFEAMDNAKNARETLEKYASDFDSDSRSAEDWQAIRSALTDDNARNVLDLLKQGADRPKLRFDRAYGEEPLCGLPLPELNVMREANRLLALAAMAAVADNKLDEAYDYLETAFAMSAQMKNEPCVISRLVQYSMLSTDITCLTKLVRKRGVSTPRAEAFIRRARAIDVEAEMTKSFDMEILVARSIFDIAIAGEYPDVTFWGKKPNRCLARIIFGVSPFNRMDFAYSLRKIIHIRTTLATPYWKVKAALKAVPDHPEFLPISKSTSPSPGSIMTRVARIRSEIENVVQLLALEIYKNKHGAYPERLEQLVPEVLPTLPLDPYTGAPFRYEKKGETYDLPRE